VAEGNNKVWGCLECGAFVETLTETGRCSACLDGLVTELGGAVTAEKAQALMAWGRREATEAIENRGTIIGAGVGVAIGVLLALLTNASVTVLIMMLYATVLGGALGRLVALRVHRRLWPHHRLQPTHNPVVRRRLILATGAWAAVPVLTVVALATSGGRGDLGTIVRRALGSVWALLAG